jgi:WD40 repeat protein
VLDAELNRSASLALLGLDDNTAVIFDIQRGGVRRTFAHQNRVRSVDFNENATLAITGSEDYTAAVWDTRSGKLISKIKHDDDVQLVKLSDDGKMALSVSKYDKAIVWDPRTAEKIAEVPLRAEHLRRGLRFSAARFSKDNRYLLTGRPDRVVQLWRLASETSDAEDNKEMSEVGRWVLPKRKAWKPSNSAVLDLAFGEQKDTFVAVGSNGFIHHLTLPEP